MSALRISRPDSAFQLSGGGKKRPRQQAGFHLAFIRVLPCLCHADGACSGPIEAAHVRLGALRAGKRATGMAEKPSDCWTLPLCRRHHADQHRHGEAAWWEARRIDPLATAAFLWIASGDAEAGKEIVRHAANRMGDQE